MARDSLKETLSTKDNFYFIELEKIKIQEGFNARKDFGDISELARDIVTNGLTQPVIVRRPNVDEPKDCVFLVDGERRFRAISYANENKLSESGEILEVKCILEEPGANEETRLIRVFSTGANSKPLTEIEQAEVVQRLMQIYHLKTKEIAQKIARPQTYVNRLLELSSAPSEVREAVKDNKLSPTAARSLARAPKATRERVLEKAKISQTPIRVREIEKETKGVSTQISTKSIKNKIVKIQQLIAEKKVDEQMYTHIIKGLELALGFWDLSN